MSEMAPMRPSCVLWIDKAALQAMRAAHVIQYFWARVVGVLMTNSSVAGSKVAVVCISTALLPAAC